MFQDTPLVPALAPEEAEHLQALIKNHCGLRVEPTKLTYSVQRAWPALARLGITDVPMLLRQLAVLGRALWPVFLPYLTINETYFMREPKQLDGFAAEALPGLRQRAAARGELQLKVLSAACSTGEEVYSLAMLLEEAQARAKVVGVDIDRDALATAEGATYGPYSFRGVTPDWRAQRFDEAGPTTWRVKPAYRDRAAFMSGNLLHVESLLAGQRFDAIFCRNVLIYFDRPTQLAVIRQLRRLLVPQGFLFLGHSEMFFNEDLGLRLVSNERSTMYQLTGEV